MRTFTNIIARLMLIAAGVLIVLSVVFEMIDSFKLLNDPAVGWWNWTNETSRSAMITFFIGCGYSLIALVAFISALTGRRSFFLFLFALILMIMPVYKIVTGVQSGTLTWNWEQIWKLIVEFLAPILYFLGWLLLVRIKRKD